MSAQVLVHHHCPTPLSGSTSSPLSSGQTSLLLGIGSRNLVVDRQEGKEEGGNFCVVGHFQFTRFDLQVFVVVLNQIMFEFHKWLERESLFVLHSTTEIYGYSANIKQPEQRNKPKNITTHYPPQQTLVSRKPQQRQAERGGGLHDTW